MPRFWMNPGFECSVNGWWQYFRMMLKYLSCSDCIWEWRWNCYVAATLETAHSLTGCGRGSMADIIRRWVTCKMWSLKIKVTQSQSEYRTLEIGTFSRSVLKWFTIRKLDILVRCWNGKFKPPFENYSVSYFYSTIWTLDTSGIQIISRLCLT